MSAPMLSTSLRGVVSQQLIPKADKKGRVAASNPDQHAGRANLIRQGKMDQLENAMPKRCRDGHRLDGYGIHALMESREITGKEAFKKAINKSRFEHFAKAS